MTTHRAVHVQSSGGALELVDAQTLSADRGQVRVAVAACGVCGTDRAIVYGGFPGITWPVTPGHAGTCRHGDLVIPVDVRFQRRRPETWQRGDELMVAVTEGLYIMERHDTEAPVDARGLGVPEQSEVWCERDHHGVKVYVWGAAAEPGVHPCLAWDSGKLDVRLVPYEGD